MFHPRSQPHIPCTRPMHTGHMRPSHLLGSGSVAKDDAPTPVYVADPTWAARILWGPLGLDPTAPAALADTDATLWRPGAAGQEKGTWQVMLQDT